MSASWFRQLAASHSRNSTNSPRGPWPRACLLPGAAVPCVCAEPRTGHLVGIPSPEGYDLRCFQPGILLELLVNANGWRRWQTRWGLTFRGWRMHRGSWQLLQSMLSLNLRHRCALCCSFSPSGPLCSLSLLLQTPRSCLPWAASTVSLAFQLLAGSANREPQHEIWGQDKGEAEVFTLQPCLSSLQCCYRHLHLSEDLSSSCRKALPP